MKTVVLAANLGAFDKPGEHMEQSVGCDFLAVTDANFPPRHRAMTPRTQARIVKTHMWDFAPGYGVYLWIDSSCVLADGDSVKWFLEKLGDSDIAVFGHPHRKTVGEEAVYLEHRLKIGCPYITPRYENELITEQLSVVDPQARLFASTAFICRPNHRVRAAMRDWWYHISRYHTIDQLSLPHVLKEQGCKVNVIEENYLKVAQLRYVRNR